MASIPRKTQKIFGSNLAANLNIAKFGSLAAGSPAYSTDLALIQTTEWLNGWAAAVVGNNSPALQDFNGAFLVFAQQLAYILERGIAEWDAGTTYYQYDLCRVNGVVYESITNANINNNPTSSHTNWASQSLAAGVSNSGQTLVVDGTGYAVEFDTEKFDTDAAFDPVTFTFTAPVAGFYQVSANVQVDNIDASLTLTEFSMRIIKNAGSEIANGTNTPNPAGARWYPSVSGLVQLAAGDTLKIHLSATDGVGTHTVSLSNGNLSIQRTRAA